MNRTPREHVRARLALPIRHLDCAGAVPGIERHLRAVPGVTSVYVNPVTELAYVDFDADRCDELALRAALARSGHGDG